MTSFLHGNLTKVFTNGHDQIHTIRLVSKRDNNNMTDTDITTSFNKDTLRIIRKSVLCTQMELARAINVSVRTVWRWENGESRPNRSSVARLAKYFGCFISDFYGSVRATEDFRTEIVETFRVVFEKNMISDDPRDKKNCFGNCPITLSTRNPITR